VLPSEYVPIGYTIVSIYTDENQLSTECIHNKSMFAERMQKKRRKNNEKGCLVSTLHIAKGTGWKLPSRNYRRALRSKEHSLSYEWSRELFNEETIDECAI